LRFDVLFTSETNTPRWWGWLGWLGGNENQKATQSAQFLVDMTRSSAVIKFLKDEKPARLSKPLEARF
jgi:hypothetical protein